ncbi:MAG: hypothetical protein L0Y67_07065 [Gammaproteobacteria bacterium]|nr:hypothetical protein [Gammaproteobacteria bacterium]
MTSLSPDERFQVYSLDVVCNKAFKAIASVFLPPEIDDCNYLVSAEPAHAGKAAYRAFLKKVWPRFRRLLHIDVVLTANSAYYAERELAGVLEEFGIPFIVLHKENLKSPGRVDFFKEIYRTRRGQFTGRKILVYNETERQLQIEAGVVLPYQVQVVGMPRLDRAHQWRANHSYRTGGRDARRRHVLFLSFGSKAGLPFIGRKRRSGFDEQGEALDEERASLSWEVLSRHCHQAMVELARNYPSIKVVIKVKGRYRETNAFKASLGKVDALPTNIKIVVGSDAFGYIVDCDVVCGFNTTALLEAIAVRKPVVVPWFDEALDPRLYPYIIDLQDTVDYVSSPKELIDQLKQYALGERVITPGQELSPQEREVLTKWTGNVDGLAGKNVREAIFRELRGTAI